MSDFHPTSPPPDRGAARWEWLLLGLLCLGTVAYWSTQYHPFVLPNNDYYHLAEEFREGGEVAGFQHLATLPLPEILDRSPVQIYRVLP